MRRRERGASRGTRLAVGLLLLPSCEYGVTANIGVSRDGNDRLVANVFACGANENIQLALEIDPDELGDTGDEIILWRVQGTTGGHGLLRTVVGETPPGFNEEIALTTRVRPSGTYVLTLHWDRLDMGTNFVPSELPADGINSGGEYLSRSDFIEGGHASCDQ